MTNKMISAELVPNIAVGSIKIGDDIGNYLSQQHSYFKKSSTDKYMEDFYDFFSPALTVFVNTKGKISSISCKAECFWKGKNLIGLSIDELLKLTDIEPTSKEKIYLLVDQDKGQNQTVYDFEELGLQIWTWRKKIVTVSVSNYLLS